MTKKRTKQSRTRNMSDADLAKECLSLISTLKTEHQAMIMLNSMTLKVRWIQVKMRVKDKINNLIKQH